MVLSNTMKGVCVLLLRRSHKFKCWLLQGIAHEKPRALPARVLESKCDFAERAGTDPLQAHALVCFSGIEGHNEVVQAG